MHPQTSFEHFHRISNTWLQALDQYSEDDLRLKTSEREWSLGQVYSHLVFINKTILKQIELCLQGKGTITDEKKFFAHLILFLNVLPPFRYKVPKVIAHVPPQPKNKQEIVVEFNLLYNTVSQLVHKIAAANESQKIAHPSLGYLSARDWFQFMAIHMKHHLRQKARIDTTIK